LGQAANIAIVVVRVFQLPLSAFGGHMNVPRTAEKELANRGRHYQAGGLIVSVSTDPASGDPSIVPISASALTRELSVAATWEKFDKRAEGWVRCDPPARHTGILFDSQTCRCLPPLAGVARQPYFRESDGARRSAPCSTRSPDGGGHE
jgi:hypothetical protein